MIGIGSPTFCESPFFETAESISEHFDLWEILSEGEDQLDRVREDIRRARTSLGLRFQVHAPLSDVNIGSVHEPMRLAAVNQIRETITACRDLDISLVTVHPGFVQGIAFLNRARALEKTKKSLVEIDVLSREHGVDVAVENLPANINATCTTASELVEAVEGTGLGLCFDMGHANTANQLDQMLALVHRFKNVHLHNNEGQWDQHNTIEDGTADIEAVVAVLRRSYHGNMVIEATDLASGMRSDKTLKLMLR